MAASVGPRVRDGSIAGAVAAFVMIVMQGIARLVAGIPMFPDLTEDLATRVIPAPIFSKVLDTLHFQAKPLLFVGLLLVQVVAGALVGGAAVGWFGPRSRQRDPAANPWRRGALLAAALWLLSGLVIFPAAGQGLFGANVAVGAIALNLELILAFALFGLTLVATLRIMDDAAATAALAGDGGRSEDSLATVKRRRLLGGVAVGAIAVVAAGAASSVFTRTQSTSMSATSSALTPAPAGLPTPPVVSAVASPLAPMVPAGPTVPASPTTATTEAASVSAPSPPATASPAPSALAASANSDWTIAGLAPEVTSTDDFYKVSKNFFSDPDPDPNAWSLQITGLVNKPYTIRYADLLKLPVVERYQTLQCISNPIGGDLIGNARWRGASLGDIIRAAGPKPGAIKVVFSAADGYQDSITLDRALSPDNLVAHTMNGEPLVAGHGMPARLLIPGIYGMKNVKWLTKIELMSTDFKGYWQQRGWSDDAFIQTMSRIDAPADGGKVKLGPVRIAGIAFAGDKGIGKVEVSIDDATTWHQASLKEPLGQYTWRLWQYTWQATAGSHQIYVRATNGAGEVQKSEQTDTLPNGATGWHSIAVTVSS